MSIGLRLQGGSLHSIAPGVSYTAPGVSKGCCLEIFRYLKGFQKHPFETPDASYLEPLETLLLVETPPPLRMELMRSTMRRPETTSGEPSPEKLALEE